MPHRASKTRYSSSSIRQRKNTYPHTKGSEVRGCLQPQSSSRVGTRGKLPYLLEEGVVQEGAGIRPEEKRKETHMTPGLSCPNPDTHPLLRDPPPFPSALPTATKATQAGFLAESWFFLLWSHTLLWESRFLPKSRPPCWVETPSSPSPGNSAEGQQSTLRQGCAEGTAPQSGGSGGRRFGGTGGKASHRWKAGGCQWPGCRWQWNVRGSWSAPRLGWCWCPGGRALCHSASPAASGEETDRGCALAPSTNGISGAG